MSRAPIIGIVCDHEPEKGRYFLWDDYVKAVEKGGGQPLLLPTALGERAGELMELIDGLLLTGSFGDVDPSLFGEEPHPTLGRLNLRKTNFEIALVRAALEKGKAVLGICYGMQTINVALGGSLVQDIPSQVKNALQHSQWEERTRPVHPVNIEKGSFLHRIVGKERIDVNSTHHQAVSRVATGLIRNAWADDGVTEGIEKTGHGFCVGVQWHPEGLIDKDEKAACIFEAFVREARRVMRGNPSSVNRK